MHLLHVSDIKLIIKAVRATEKRQLAQENHFISFSPPNFHNLHALKVSPFNNSPQV